MKRIIFYSIDVIKILLALFIAPIYKIFIRKNMYLIGERKDQCQDNGYHLFKYVREKHKNDKFYYCITKDSKQLDKIKYLENIVYYKSFKHYLYYVVSKKLVCAHVGSCTPDTPIIWKLEEKKVIKKNRIFIQHGITKEFIPSLTKNESMINTFICGAKPEFQFVKKEFGYSDNSVKYLGFCRFDNLHSFKTKKQILIMPTWRQWFGMDGNNVVSSEEFVKSDYFKAYNSIINNKKLSNMLKSNSMKIIFYPHNEMQRYLHLFKSNFDNVIVANKEYYDVQNLLKESEILITDYSSIAFDFAYMKKPVIYYQFDDIEYYSNHYAKGYFDYKKDGFGPLVKNIEELVKLLKNLDEVKNNKIYLERMYSFFKIHDCDNCKRHYEEIIKLN